MRGPARVTNHGTTPPQAAQDLSRESSATVRLEQSNPSMNNAAVQPVPKRLRVAARESQEEQLKKKNNSIKPQQQRILQVTIVKIQQHD